MERPLTRLRAATKPLHDQLDALPYARAVIDGSLPLGDYARFLRAVHAVHMGLEQVVELTGDASLREVVGPVQLRRTALERDLSYLQVDTRAVDGALLHALVLAQRMRRDASIHRARVLGYAYVLEGSQNGGLVQAAALSRRSELQAGGLTYLRGAGKATHELFQDFVARLEAALFRDEDVEQAISGASAAFDGFSAILTSLASQEVRRDSLVGALNPEAGTHPVPADVREVEAAIRAGELSFGQFAYYEQRYGERGLRFTRSDSAWLATLSRDDAELTTTHVRWLGRVLATRGMPRLLLERHLEVLVRCLQDVPDLGATYGALTRATEELRAERESVFSTARELSLQEAFLADLAAELTAAQAPEPSVTPPASTRVSSESPAAPREVVDHTERGVSAREAATLLIAAVADEKRGIASSVQSLTSWLCAPAHVSEPWRDACERLLLAARRVAAERASLA